MLIRVTILMLELGKYYKVLLRLKFKNVFPYHGSCHTVTSSKAHEQVCGDVQIKGKSKRIDWLFRAGKRKGKEKRELKNKVEYLT